jgi:hypothetical protein
LNLAHIEMHNPRIFAAFVSADEIRDHSARASSAVESERLSTRAEPVFGTITSTHEIQ